ncbi:Fe-S cluster assembly protein SufD [Chitinophagaceae bacterium MMS25-I14]
MNITEQLKERFNRLQQEDKAGNLATARRDAFQAFSTLGIPGSKHEEWKYTRIAPVFNKEYSVVENASAFSGNIDAVRLPGSAEANELIFINGIFSKELSAVRSRELIVLPLEEAANGTFANTVEKHFGHSSQYLKDGINALNTAFAKGGVFVNIGKGKTAEHPVYIYNIADTNSGNTFAQPRSLIHVEQAANITIAETYITFGAGDSFTNQVMEVAVEQDAMLYYYKIQNDASNAGLVSTTHIRQVGKSYVHTATISLNGSLVRNNLNIIMEAAHSEAHMYGLYFQKGNTHVDNHTLVDNVQPGCLSNELYKGIIDGNATAVFNGKIFVRQAAQKTNAYQSNKNILLSEDASVNSKPQLEIFADDVKCSHGCTVGQLDEEGLFYMRSRGISEKTAKSLLIRAFAMDVTEQVKYEPLRIYVEKLIAERLEFEVI